MNNAWNHGVMQLQSHFKACRSAMLNHIPDSGNMVNSPITPDGWTDNYAANSTLVMLGRIDTLDSADDARIDEIKRIVRQLAAAPKP